MQNCVYRSCGVEYMSICRKLTAAVHRLRLNSNIQLRFVTNTTKESKDTLLQRLHRIGFVSISKADMFTSLSAAVKYVKMNELKPFYMLTEDAKKDFADEQPAEFVYTNELNGDENAVVVGLAPDKFIYESINKAFRVLMKDDSKLIAVHEGKYYKRGDGLALGPGCFTRGLEYSTGKSGIVIGKPNPYFFNCAIPEGIAPHECCMICDDINDDIFGAMNVGMKAILVRTGKYIQNIESKYPDKPTAIAESFAESVHFMPVTKTCSKLMNILCWVFIAMVGITSLV